MIAVETLLRLSFLRGGTDFDNFFLNRGDAVLSTTVNKYVYVTVKEQLDDMICVDYSHREIVGNIDKQEQVQGNI